MMIKKLQKYMEEDVLWAENCNSLFEALPDYEPYRAQIQKSMIARLVGSLPYLARTDEPYRDAMSNLFIFVIASYGPAKSVYKHSPQDDADPFSRLRPIMNFTGGDEDIIHRGMSLIALVLLNDYKKDQEDDLISGHYNPLNSGAWDYQEMNDNLRAQVLRKPCRKMDRILNLSVLPFVYWNA